MAMPGEQDGSEDVADFLERIKDLGDKRLKEDEERTRKLEEEILQGRKERQARRAERARSISPTKDSPLSSSILSLQKSPDTPIGWASPQSPSLKQDSHIRKAEERSAVGTEPLDLEDSSQHSDRNNSFSRPGNLSWQQRPTSQGSATSRSRPRSMIAKEISTTSPRVAPEPTSIGEPELTMSQKAKALELKDPSWFKQTADRGVGSAAFRKNQDSAETVASTIKLPGLSRESSVDLVNSKASQGKPDHQPPSSQGSVPATISSTSASDQSNDGRSPLPNLSSQRFEPPSFTGGPYAMSESKTSRTPLMSPSQGRISPERIERPVSPTKGLGGFVQSAMMKRSDSVSKRWSQQAAPGVVRGSSIAGNRAGKADSNEARNLKGEVGREKSPNSPSRPGSRDNASSNLGLTSSKDNEFSRPSLPDRTSQKYESGSIKSLLSETAPFSPSRTMDQKRWSPTKASWLEAAINKAEAPKAKPAPLQQPSWMAEINKAKQARGSVDLSKNVARHDVAVGGLLRSPPIGATALLPSPGLNSMPSSERAKPSPYVSTKFDESHAKGQKEAFPAARVSDLDQDSLGRVELNALPISNMKSATTANGDNIENKAVSVSPTEEMKPSPPKAKPETPPKKDFRSSLRSRQQSSSGLGSGNESEFKNIFGKLKKAETKNYVAPDELKSNIMRGKTGLNITGGPKPYEKKDEFKDSILKKKEEMKSAPSVAIKPKLDSARREDAPIPEAIVKRQGITAKMETNSSATSKSASGLETDATIGIGLKKARTSSPEPKIQCLVSKVTAPARLQTSGSKATGKATGGFNSALAGMLARGPPANGNGGSPLTSQGYETSVELASAVTPLTHTTKSRARGPKRRAPTTTKHEEGSNTATESILPSNDKTKTEAVATPPAPATKEARAGVSMPVKQAAPLPLAKIMTSSSKAQLSSNLTFSADSMPKKTISSPRHDDISSPIVKNKSPPATKPNPLSPIKTGVAEASPAEKAESHLLSSTIAISTANMAIKPPKSPPPTLGKKPESLSRVISEASMKSPSQASAKNPAVRKAQRVISEFFEDELSVSKGKIDIDAQAVLGKTPNPEGKIKTLRKEIWEITGDGKKISVPAQQEHILFDSCMYLCTHVFGSQSGKRMTEVYLWHGDGVSYSAVEDAQLFCRNAAKEAGGRLIVVGQGRESSNFFEALGGIVITRCGSSSRSINSPYMLCGRRHMGQIAFDEVAFSPSSVCSGFPHIIAAIGGKVYLWKGKGSGADELGCARLIAMDIGLTGEIEEVDEGNEPASFWHNVFKSANKPPPMAEHWSTKASIGDKFGTRLFAIDADARPKSASSFINWGRRPSAPSGDDDAGAQIREISPYTLSDLSPSTIYVLDSFFEIYVIVGFAATAKLTSFRAALFFAQEYGILAASMEDRPFVPVGTVVLGGAPLGLRHAFRKWDDTKFPTKKEGKDGLKEGEKAFSLNEALEALS